MLEKINSVYKNSVVDIHTIEHLLRIKFSAHYSKREYLLTQKKKELIWLILSLIIVASSAFLFLMPHPKGRNIPFFLLYSMSVMLSVFCFFSLERARYQAYYEMYPGLKLFRKNFQDLRIISMQKWLKKYNHLNKTYVYTVIDTCKKYEALKAGNEKSLLQHPVLSILVTLFASSLLDWLIQKQNPQVWVLVLCAIGMLIGITLLIISRETKLIKVQRLRETFVGVELLSMYDEANQITRKSCNAWCLRRHTLGT